MTQAPEAFKHYQQFILWRPTPAANGKVDKIPISHHTLSPHDPHDPAIYLTYQAATDMADLLNLGLGFVFTANDPFFYIDIDNAHNSDWSETSQALCSYFQGCAIEISQSGKGIHIFGSGSLPPHGCKNTQQDLELYTDKRFVALTGTSLQGDAAFQPPPATLQWLVTTYFPTTPGSSVPPADWSAGPCPEWSGPADDTELLTRMLQSKSAAAIFGGRASVSDLWIANDDVLGTVFPSSTGTHTFDHSSADAALCAHLAFWTGKDCERMDRLFRMSALTREKWTDREDYRRRTILGAVGRCSEVFGSNKPNNQITPEIQAVMQAPAMAPPDLSGVKSGYQFMSVTQQMELFKGCVYVRDAHRILTPDGGLLKPEQFRAMYGGYVFALDDSNNKVTKSAWEVFTESQGVNFPKVFYTCFRPELPPGEIINEEGGTMVNTYVPAAIKRVAGDATPFLNHLTLMLPDNRDRLILLSYMAACVQHIGVKFQWCPLLQGLEGNGKTLIATCVAYALGWRFTHTPNAKDLANKFNLWILGKLFIIVEEVYMKERTEALESLKPLITNPLIELQGKGTNQKLGDNRANFFMCTNHKDAIRKTKTDRRYCVFYTAQQAPLDIRRAGMHGRYFPQFVKWLKKEGYAIVAHYLMTFKIPDEFNPAVDCHRAPDTTSTSEALMLSMGGLEQELFEAMNEGRYGFCGGWISSQMFNALIKSRNDEKRIPPNKRRQIIAELGYVVHPGLHGGRVNTNIPQEGGKPILYLRHDHPALRLRGAPEITRAYKTAQEETP